MRDRSSRKKSHDLNLLAAAIVTKAIGEASAEEPDDPDPHVVPLGRTGGAKGGPARAAKLSPERGCEFA
jgi:hypothetical protein